MHHFFTSYKKGADYILDKLVMNNSSLIFSTRKIYSKAPQACIGVRRSSDNAEVDINYSGNYIDTSLLLSFTGGENLIYPSETFSTWNVSNTTLSAVDTEVAPDGTTTADTIKINNATGIHSIYKGFPIAPTLGATYVMSFYVKAGTASICQIAAGGAAFTNSYANFDLSNGTITAEVSCTAAITALASGWYRISISAVAGSVVSGSAALVFISSTTDARNPSYLGNDTDTLIFWGAQLNTATLKTYYKTVTGISGDCFVTKWYDQTLNRNDAIQTVAGSQPRIVSSSSLITSANGKLSLRFVSASNTYLTTKTSVLTDSYSQIIFHCENVAAPAAGNGLFFRNTSGGATMYLNSTNSQRYTINNGAVLPSTFVGDGDTGGLFECLYYPTNAGRLIRNGTVLATGNVGSSTTNGTFNIGSAGANSWVNYISSEFIYINGAEEDYRIKLEKNIADYYGVTLP